MKIQLTRQDSSKRRGVAAVEMAFVFPIFMLLVLGIIEFGRFLMVGQLVTNAAREGARMAIRGTSTEEEVKQNVLDFVSSAAGVDSGKISVQVSTGSGATIQAADSKDPITVNVGIRFVDVSYLPFLSQDGGGNDPFTGLRAQHDASKWITGVSIMRKE